MAPEFQVTLRRSQVAMPSATVERSMVATEFVTLGRSLIAPVLATELQSRIAQECAEEHPSRIAMELAICLPLCQLTLLTALESVVEQLIPIVEGTVFLRLAKASRPES
jgi:hypothetical protein